MFTTLAHTPIFKEKRKMQKNKILATIVAIILISSMAISLSAQSTASGEVINGINYNDATATAIKAGMHWDLNANASSTRFTLWERYQDRIPTWVYAIVSPNPVGVGQEFTMVIYNPQLPYQSSEGNDIRYKYHVDITKPDGTVERLPSSGSLTSDSTGTTYTKYTPDSVGNYSVMVVFEELYWRWSTSGAGRDYYGVTLLSSNRTYSVTVQQDPVTPNAVINYPLPTEYWSRPIESQNTAWGAVSSNWLNNAKDRDYGSTDNRVQTEGSAPNSGHILWTKPTEDGGMVGGDDYFSTAGETFNAGHQYQTRFSDRQIIMHGRLYYQEPIAWAGSGGDWVCVDLKTGQEIWRNKTMAYTPSFGYYYDLDDMNQHGVVNPGWIISEYTQNGNRMWAFIHPRYGTTIPLNVTDVPAGTMEIGPKGEVLKYIIQNEGTSTNQKWRLYEWNSSNVFTSQNSGTRNASLAATNVYSTTYSPAPVLNTWDFNVSVSLSLTGSVTIRAAKYNDYVLISNGSFAAAGTGSLTYHNAESCTLTAISIKDGEEGPLDQEL
jgi:hypothetical protein